jgi:NADH:ubiquinone oxidoreductase subunit E
MLTILVEVCAGTRCTLMGAMDIIDNVESLRELQQRINPNCEIEVRPISCTHACDNGPDAPVVIINGETLLSTDVESVMEKISALAASCGDSPR